MNIFEVIGSDVFVPDIWIHFTMELIRRAELQIHKLRLCDLLLESFEMFPRKIEKVSV